MASSVTRIEVCQPFRILHMGHRWTNLSYANVATTSPLAHRVSREWEDSLARGGAAEFDADAEKLGMMPLREAAAKLLSCDVTDIFCGSSATAMMCSVAWAVMPSEKHNIVSSRAAFPSTVYPWSRVALETGAEIRLASYDHNHYTKPQDILDLIDKNTSVVVISHVEYANGQRYDLRKFSEAAHSVGAILMVDATQSMGMVPIDAVESGADVIVSSGYKWLRGTYGAAVGFLSPKAKSLIPGLVGFRSHKDIWDMRSDRMNLPEDASRFEFTTLHFGALHGLAASIEEMLEIGIESIWKHDLSLADAVIELAQSRGLEVVSPIDHNQRSAIVSIRPPAGHHSAHIVKRLQDEFGILVTDRSGMIRISPHIDNERSQIELLFSSFDTILSK